MLATNTFGTIVHTVTVSVADQGLRRGCVVVVVVGSDVVELARAVVVVTRLGADGRVVVEVIVDVVDVEVVVGVVVEVVVGDGLVVVEVVVTAATGVAAGGVETCVGRRTPCRAEWEVLNAPAPVTSTTTQTNANTRSPAHVVTARRLRSLVRAGSTSPHRRSGRVLDRDRHQLCQRRTDAMPQPTTAALHRNPCRSRSGRSRRHARVRGSTTPPKLSTCSEDRRPAAAVDVLDAFAGLLDVWRPVAQRSGPFRWTSREAPERVQFLLYALYVAGLVTERQAAAGQAHLRPAAADEFHYVLVREVLAALEHESDADAHFAQELRNVWAIARDLRRDE